MHGSLSDKNSPELYESYIDFDCPPEGIPQEYFPKYWRPGLELYADHDLLPVKTGIEYRRAVKMGELMLLACFTASRPLTNPFFVVSAAEPTPIYHGMVAQFGKPAAR